MPDKQGEAMKIIQVISESKDGLRREITYGEDKATGTHHQIRTKSQAAKNEWPKIGESLKAQVARAVTS